MSTPAQRLASFTSSTHARRHPEARWPARPAASPARHARLRSGGARPRHRARTCARRCATDGSGPASAIGVPTGPRRRDAALVNGAACHALDFDDTHPGAIAHVSVAVRRRRWPGASSRARPARSCSWALVAGNEVTTRIGMAAGERVPRARLPPHRGLRRVRRRRGGGAAARPRRRHDHPGARHRRQPRRRAAGVPRRRLLDQAPPRRLRRASASSPRARGAWRHRPAHRAGGPLRLYGAFAPAGRRRRDRLGDLGVHWETPRIAFKPYPACHYLHAAARCHGRGGRRGSIGLPDEIEELVVVGPARGRGAGARAAADKAQPRSDYEAKFSLPYSVASYLPHGRVDVSTYTDEAIADQEVLDARRHGPLRGGGLRDGPAAPSRAAPASA